MRKIRETKKYQVWEMDDGRWVKRWKESGVVEDYVKRAFKPFAVKRKITDEEVREIYNLYTSGEMSSGRLSKRYGVSDRLVMRIVKGKYRNEDGSMKDTGLRYAPGRGVRKVLN